MRETITKKQSTRISFAPQMLSFILTAIICILYSDAHAQPASRFYVGAPGTPVNFEIDGNYFAAPSSTSIDWSDNGPRGVLLQNGSLNAIPGLNIIDDEQVSRWKQDENWGCSGCIDYSQFDGTSNKNGDDISTGTNNWTYSTNGQGPQKNDITNTMMFLKKQGADVWLIGGVETRAVNGDSHIDFEYNQAGVYLTGSTNSGYIKGSGNLKGRTVGDFLVSIDYDIGGSNPSFNFRTWVNPGKWQSVNLTPGVDYYFAANVSATIPAVSPGYGVDQAGNPTNVSAPLQFAEFALKSSVLNSLFINPTACNPAATVNVKTRSSTSFTAELKDFVFMPIVITLPPVAHCPSPQCVCQSPSGNSFTISDSDCRPTYTYKWKLLSNDATLNVTIANPNACQTGVNTTGYGTATFRLVVSKGVCADSCTTTITVKPTPSCNITGPISVLPNTTASYSGPSDAAQYQWTVTGNASIIGANNTRTVQIKAGASCDPYSVQLTTSNPGCTSSTFCTNNCSINVTVEPCNRICTYTQGAYGNPGGRHCDGQTTPDFVTGLLSTPLIVGAGTKTVTFNPSDVNCLISVLPSGGTAAALNGSYNCNNVQPLNNGKLYNILLGQTITLALNTRIAGNPLADLALTGRYITTAPGTGSGCAAPGVASGPSQTWVLPASVINYLGSNNKVSHLLQLANNALGGVYNPTGNQPSLSAINNAVDIINNAFDGCRILVGITTTSSARLGNSQTDNTPGDEISFYPNPFSESMKITFPVQKDMPVSVEILQMNGQKLQTVFEGISRENSIKEVLINGNDLMPGMYLCKVASGSNYTMKRIVMVRQ